MSYKGKDKQCDKLIKLNHNKTKTEVKLQDRKLLLIHMMTFPKYIEFYKVMLRSLSTVV